jgi:molybdopterin converting factor small subunit
MMKITVHFYANLKDKSGQEQVLLTLPAGVTVGELIDHLKVKYPVLIPHLTEKIVIAINQKIALRPDPIPDNAMIDLMPPIGGG